MSSTPSPDLDEVAPETPARERARAGRPPIHAHFSEIRARVDPALYTALVREASAQGISVAESVRRILEAHYARLARSERELGTVLDQVALDVADARHETRLVAGLLGSMLELALKALLVRLPPASDRDSDDRLRQAAEGHEKWMKQLSRRLAEGGAEELLAFVLPRLDPSETDR
jgi:hypothetical protein